MIKVNIHRELTFAVVWGKLNKEWILLDNVGLTIIDKQKNSSKIGRCSKDIKNWEASIHMFLFTFEEEGKI